ncbi:NCS2 family permease [Lactiplantibacillus plantarum]|uniref:NCS2 family permease n=1 Tax=Lactiplantibacillus plantarum TaxID=1590 RepID=UPI003C12C2C1
MILEQLFHLRENRTSVRRELIGGLTTFLAMSYILAVNPELLGSTGMSKTAVFTATILAAIVGCLLMGLVANFPVALAPGMGLNAFFTYTVVQEWHIPWQTALAGVFVAGILFILLTLSKLRDKLINLIPSALKYAVSAGIGLFIAFSGLQTSGIIVANKSNAVALGNLHSPTVLLAIFGIIVGIMLVTANVTGGIFWGMFITAAVGMIFGIIPLPTGIISGVPSVQPIFGQAVTHLGNINSFQMIIVILTFFIIGLFDTSGTLVGVATEAGMVDKESGEVNGVGKALFSGALATTLGAVFGTSPTTAYVESTSGVAVGARTGLSSVFVALLFAIAAFFSPILTVITSAVTASALIIVGILMLSNVQYIDWTKFEIAVPAFFTMIMMLLTYSISEGLAVGFIFYPITMTVKGRWREVNALMWTMMVVFILYFAFVA